MAKYVAVLGAIGACWLLKEDYFELQYLICFAVTYWLIMEIWDRFIDL